MSFCVEKCVLLGRAGVGEYRCCMECDERKGCTHVCDNIKELDLSSNPQSPAYYKSICDMWTDTDSREGAEG